MSGQDQGVAFGPGCAPFGAQPQAASCQHRIPNAIDAAFEKYAAMIRRHEREDVTRWLVETSPDIEALATMPRWQAMLWAFTHPVRFAAAAALANAGHAIHRGEHAQGMSAGTERTAQQAEGEARQPGPKDAPNPNHTQGSPDHDDE